MAARDGGDDDDPGGLGEVRDLLGPTGLLDVGLVSDARLSALAPSAIPPGTWWAADDRDDVGDGGRGRSRTGSVVEGAIPRRHLAAVRTVLHGAASVVAWSDDVCRGAFVRAGDVVLVDRIDGGAHRLLLAELAVAVALLAVGLDPLDVARHRVAAPVGPRVVAAGEVPALVPPAADRLSTIRLARVAVGPPPVESVVTFVGTAGGVTAWRALPDGDVVVSSVDRDGVVGAALALLVEQPARVVA